MTYHRSPFVSIVLFAIFVAMLFAGSAIAVGQSEYLVYSFPKTGHSIAAGCNPEGTLVADSAGNLYGTTIFCGVGAGTVFKMTRPVPPSKQWTETVLYAFTGINSGSGEAGYPRGGVVFDAAGQTVLARFSNCPLRLSKAGRGRNPSSTVLREA